MPPCPYAALAAISIKSTSSDLKDAQTLIVRSQGPIRRLGLAVQRGHNRDAREEAPTAVSCGGAHEIPDGRLLLRAGSGRRQAARD